VVSGRSLLSAIMPEVVVNLVNSNRAAKGVKGVINSPLLDQAATLKAKDMADKGYFSHAGPDGKLPWYWLDAAGYAYSYAGENLAINYVESADVVLAWMNSPGHRENILNDKYTEIGIGVAEGFFEGQKATFVVQFFGSPAQKPVRVAVTGTSEKDEINVKEAQSPVKEDSNYENNSFVEIENQGAVLAENTDRQASVNYSFPLLEKLIVYLYLLISALVVLTLALQLSAKRRIRTEAPTLNALLLIIVIAAFSLADYLWLFK